jgi:hypothetical protein
LKRIDKEIVKHIDIKEEKDLWKEKEITRKQTTLWSGRNYLKRVDKEIV